MKKTTLAVNDGHIHIDEFHADVWLSIGVTCASVHIVITPDEARQLIEALQKVIA